MAASAPVVGDIIIVSQAEGLPSGYQLAEPPFVISETNEKRYLAYKKQTQAPNTLAVSDVVVCNDVTLVPPGYKTLNYTTPDNLESFPDKLVMIKKEGWSQVLGGIPQAVTDIMLLQKSQRDDMPCGYKMTHDINGLCICIKRNNLKYCDGLYDDDEAEEDDVFGEALIGSDDDDFYEIPSSSGRGRGSKGGSEEVDGCGQSKANKGKKNRRTVIKSIPIDNTDQNGDTMYPQVSQSIRLSPLYSNLHQLPNSFGYPLDQFLTTPPSTVLCSKCRNVLMNPYSMSCCNSYICENCLLHLQHGSTTKCPTCANCDYDFESSLSKRDEVDLLLLKCSNSSKGCKWRGQLGELDIHLFINCLYAEISCDSDTCRARFLRRDAPNHKCGSALRSNSKSLSSTRSASSVEELTHRISEIQKKQEETMSVVRQELRKFSNAKDNSDTQSNYVKLSFEVRALKRQLAESLQREQRLEGTVKQHEKQLQLLKDTQDMFRVQFDNLIDQLQMKSLSPTSSQLLPMSPVPSPPTLKQPPCEFLMSQFTQYLRTQDAEWYSDPFLSDLHGYKMCLQVVPSGMMSSAGKDVSICVKLMRGECDDQLTWPFQGKITVQILNWICDQRHATRVIDFNADAKRYGACGRVPVGCPGDRAIKGWGILPFLPHGYLPLNKERNTEFMRNNRLCIRVVSITY